MKYMRNFAIAGLMLSVLLGIHACAPSIREKPKIDLVWPLPPDEPKIRYIDTIRSTLDLGRKKGITEAIFGDEDIQSFKKPYGVAVDKNGKIYVTDVGKVYVFDLINKDYDIIGVKPGVGRVVLPLGITAASDGKIFVTDITADRVYVYLDGKNIGTLGETGELDSPSGVALDEKRGLAYIVDSKKHFVIVYSMSNYTKLRTIGKRGTGDGEFNYPTNIAVDSEGMLYVVDTGNFRVQIFDRDGNFLKSLGKLGDAPGTFARPKGIAIDSEGNIYVVDTAFENFQIFDQDGNLLLFVGGQGVEPGKFTLPAGMAIDHQDRIYVVDQLPGQVQIFQFLGGMGRKKQTGVQGEKEENKGTGEKP
jgi:sugar lactone lactonase YvrE